MNHPGEELRTRVCPSQQLAERGRGVRFQGVRDGQAVQGFAVRYAGRVYAFQNECPHQGHELDWTPGAFYDREGQALICASHGARYDPRTGRCLEGACGGAGLVPIAVREADGWVWTD